jgi:hypothetical protein
VIEHRPWVAEMMREIEQMEVSGREIDDDLRSASRQRRSGSSMSVVYSIRLDRREIEALERRATQMGLRPTVLARNLIRTGLMSEDLSPVVDAARHVVGAVEELQALLP